MNIESRVLESLKMLDKDTVELLYKDGVKVHLEDMKRLLLDLYTFTKNKRLKRLIIISKHSSLDIQARLYLQEENKSKKESIIAEAVVVNSLAQKMTTNFYLKFIKDIYPSKFFTDIEKAKEWLKSQN